ncbi:MAG: DUF3223 domain-containing protein [Hyphomicrobiaceae bacterium]|nr:MAG: DUF3223 domain-containing protein [Hyphomicrobiaceae bacterium]
MSLPDIATSTKKLLTETVRGIVADAELNEEILFNDGRAEGRWLESLLSRHPRWAEKCGRGYPFGVRVVMVAAPGFRPNRGLRLIRADGSTVDISWREAISPTDPKQSVRLAMRNHIEPQIFAYKEKRLDSDNAFISEISGERHHISNGAVDHAPPMTFIEIVQAFFVSEESALPFAELSIRLAPHRDNDHRDYFEDEVLAERWCEFHRANAVLRLITKLEHKQLSKRKP